MVIYLRGDNQLPKQTTTVYYVDCDIRKVNSHSSENMIKILAKLYESSTSHSIATTTVSAGAAAETACDHNINAEAVVVVVLLFYAHGKHLRSCRDGQLT